jgi:hypothetical protein
MNVALMLLVVNRMLWLVTVGWLLPIEQLLLSIDW